MTTRAAERYIDTSLQAKIAAMVARVAEVPISEVSAEEFLESAEWCDIPLTKAQRCLARLAEGLPIVHLTSAELHYHTGAGSLSTRREKPRIAYVRKGRRSGGTLICGALGLIRNALTLPLRRLPEQHERPERDGMVGPSAGDPLKAYIVAPRLDDQAAKALDQLLGKCLDSPKLRARVVNQKGYEFGLRRDDERVVTIKALAASPRGTNVRGGWCIGALINEADFFGERGAAVNLNEQIEAIRPALVQGGQVFAESSPWNDSGDFHRGHSDAWGDPGTTASFHSNSMLMNPTAFRAAELAEIERKDPDEYEREILANPPAVSKEQFFSEAAIMAACCREAAELEPNGAPHYAGCDTGLRRNSAAFALARNSGGKAELAKWIERVPPQRKLTAEEAEEERREGRPPGLAPSVVFREFAEIGLAYSAIVIHGDQYYEDTAIEEVAKVKNAMNRSLWYETIVDNTTSTTKLLTDLKSLMDEGNAIFPNDEGFKQQLREVRTSKGQGRINVMLGRTGAKHGDVLKAVALAMVQVPLNIVTTTRDQRIRTGAGRPGMRFGGGGRGF